MQHRPVRVLLHPFFFLAETWNGIDECLLLLSKYLDRSRYELLLLTHESDGPQTRILAERAAIRAIPAPYSATASARARLSALRSLYAAEGVDLLHMHSPVAGGQAIPALAAHLAGVAVTLATYHQIQPWRLAARGRAINYAVHAVLVDRTIAVSRGVRESLISAAGLPRARIGVVLNGIDMPEPSNRPSVLPVPRRGEVRIGYFGRLSEEKGLPVLLEALAALASRCPQARTYIVGEGPERAGLEATAAALGITDRVQFLGYRADARAIMEQVDLVVHVPRYEGFGLVMLEAMAAGRPLVVNDAPGGMTDIVIPGETGLIVPSGAVGALAEALTRLVANPAQRRHLGQNGRSRCEQRFSARGMVEQNAALYDELLGRRRAGARTVSSREGPRQAGNGRR